MTTREIAKRIVANWRVNFSPDEDEPLINMIDAALIAQEEAVRHVVRMQIRFLQDELQRQRDRNHAVVDDLQRRYAPDMKALSDYRWLQLWAQREIESMTNSPEHWRHRSRLYDAVVQELIRQRNGTRDEFAQFRTELSDEATALLELLDRQDHAALEPDGDFLQRAAEFATGAEKLLLRLREKESES